MTAHVVTKSAPRWFLGTLYYPKLSAEQTGDRFALWETVLPNGAAPPLHTHPQDETFYLLDGDVITWAVEPEAASDDDWVDTHAQRCGPGAAVFIPGGMPHTFRVESDTARMLFLSTPAGIEAYVHALSEPAAWPWLQPPPTAPRIPRERLEVAEREHNVVRVGPAPINHEED